MRLGRGLWVGGRLLALLLIAVLSLASFELGHSQGEEVVATKAQQDSAAQVVLSPDSPTPLEIHSKHWLYGYPLGTPATNDLIIRDLYALSSNDTTKFADWVAYQLTPHETLGILDLERDWHTDPWLDESETLEATPYNQDDYRLAFTQAGYDRGHLAPLGSFTGSRFASQVNFYSNIVPQKSKLNQGPWRILEEQERILVNQYLAIWVMTGPLYDGTVSLPLLPNANETHTIPTGFWKIIAVENGAGMRAAAFIMEQDDEDTDLGQYVVTIDEIENRSGLNFFWEMPDADEQILEQAGGALWVINLQ